MPSDKLTPQDIQLLEHETPSELSRRTGIPKAQMGHQLATSKDWPEVRNKIAARVMADKPSMTTAELSRKYGWSARTLREFVLAYDGEK